MRSNALSPELLGIASILIFLLGLFALSCAASRVECLDVGRMTGRSVAWSLWSGCYVSVDGKMVPLSVWRNIEGGQ